MNNYSIISARDAKEIDDIFRKGKCDVPNCEKEVLIRCLYCEKDYCKDHSVALITQTKNRCIFCQFKLNEGLIQEK